MKIFIRLHLKHINISEVINLLSFMGVVIKNILFCCHFIRLSNYSYVEMGDGNSSIVCKLKQS